MAICKWCSGEFDLNDKPLGWMANHSRWCSENPRRNTYKVGTRSIAYMNEAKRKSGITNQYVKAKMEGRSIISPLKGNPHPNPIKKHRPETIEMIRQAALKSNHRRLRKGMVEYNGVMMDSSWEVALAKRLDELGIRWNRPDPLKWIDNEGRVRNYFPDFYLVDYNLFLDPKNKAAYENQKHKIEILKKTYTNILFILTLDECKNFSL